MVLQRCMMSPRPPRAMSMRMIADGHAILVAFTLRAWTLAEGAMREPIEFWPDGLERRDDAMILKIPIAPMSSQEWKGTQIALATLREIVSAFRGTDLSELAGEEDGQLLWIDGLTLLSGLADIAVLASPEFATFIRQAPQAVFDRTTLVMTDAERQITGKNDVSSTRGASRYNTALHLSVGEDCACLGVPAIECSTSGEEGWPAYGHSLRFVSRIMLVLVGLATLEDECRAAKAN
jgi:hypothetical protein